MKKKIILDIDENEELKKRNEDLDEFFTQKK